MNLPAFPSHGSMGEVVQQGMSLRDYFAAAALQGLMATVPTEYQGKLTGEIYAPMAYALADAMLAERDK